MEQPANAERNNSLRDFPLYGATEAARNLGIHVSTLRNWVSGLTYKTLEGSVRFHPLIEPAGLNPLQISFNNLVELHVLWTLRNQHLVPLATVREALDYSAQALNVNRPLLVDLREAFGEIFLSHVGNLIHLRKSEQLLLERHFETNAKRIDVDKFGPSRLYPRLRALPESSDHVLIDPLIRSGRPNVGGVPTEVIVGRIDAGEDAATVSSDYDLPIDAIWAALYFENPQLAA